MPDKKTELIKINALLENVGYQLSRSNKDPSLERKAEDIINNCISDIIRFTVKLIDSKEVTNKKLLTVLQNIKSQDIILNWADHSAALKRYVNDPEHSWEK